MSSWHRWQPEGSSMAISVHWKSAPFTDREGTLCISVGTLWLAFGVPSSPSPSPEPTSKWTLPVHETAQPQPGSLLEPGFAEKRPTTPESEREQSHYLHCAGTCSCRPPASRCLFRDHKPQRSSSPRAHRAHLWHTAVRWEPQPLKGRAQCPRLRLAAVTRNQEAWRPVLTASTSRVTWERWLVPLYLSVLIWKTNTIPCRLIWLSAFKHQNKKQIWPHFYLKKQKYILYVHIHNMCMHV